MNGEPEERLPAEVSTPALSAPGHLTGLLRHFSDLRDGTHGGSVSRRDKEAHFAHAVELLAPVARQALDEINAHLLLGSGTVVATGLQRKADGSSSASWDLVWPEQLEAGIAPVSLRAYYGFGFHHPHLRGATVGDWPLNVFTIHDATDQLCILRAIATSDLHNLVFQADYRIIPAVTRPSSISPP
ncbi:MAG: hypothetical protein JWO62_486 [Acidimicrobiaceae bacterium]|jgi:hypothetical protein|nr:hypothetical protein [Acidimicrobiaceae bacterium]